MGENIRNFSVSLALWTLASLGLFGSARASARTSSVPVLNVLVFNYSKASPALLAGAEWETSRIFARSGIHFLWTHCPPIPSAESPSTCQGEPTPGEIRVRVLVRRLDYNFQDSTFGFAIAPTVASVYYEPVQRLLQTTTSSESDASIILGCLIAHEIGHLLLGHDQHTINGIMQARWGIQQIQQARGGALEFTPQQAKRMQRNARIRIKPAAGGRFHTIFIPAAPKILVTSAVAQLTAPAGTCAELWRWMQSSRSGAIPRPVLPVAGPGIVESAPTINHAVRGPCIP